MELSHQMRMRKAVLRACWLPRLQNEEADALLNGDFRHFTPPKRVKVTLAGLSFGVLNELMAEEVTYHDEVTELRSKEKLAKETAQKLGSPAAAPAHSKRRKRAGESLRYRDPW